MDWFKKGLLLVREFNLNIVWKCCRTSELALLHFLFQNLFFLFICNLLLDYSIVNFIFLIFIGFFNQINTKKLFRNVFGFLLTHYLRNMMVFKNDLIGVNIVQNYAIWHIIYSLQPQFFCLFSLLKSTCYKLIEILSNIKVYILYYYELNYRCNEVLIFKHFWLILVIILVSNVIVHLGSNL